MLMKIHFEFPIIETESLYDISENNVVVKLKKKIIQDWKKLIIETENGMKIEKVFSIPETIRELSIQLEDQDPWKKV